jgi:hypothetical protein
MATNDRRENAVDMPAILLVRVKSLQIKLEARSWELKNRPLRGRR